ncbi:Tim44 domain-containing protein [Vibrio vulnificus]|nr:Tim44 domain-containing protein [Vibrio vulnificus]HAS8129021.1 Tim44 domain-containing protein [Vibrio vulnificus]
MSKLVVYLSAIVVACLVVAEPAFAGPGGKIASVLSETFWGKVLILCLLIFFSPLIVYVFCKEKLAEQRARKDLRFMAGYSELFEWLKVQERVKDCFYRVHAGWESDDLSSVSDWMTDWYWQNQQQVHLENWKKQGLVNVCKVTHLSKIKPLLFVHRNQSVEHEGSMVVVAITGETQDYLMVKETGKIVEGSKKFKDVETIWTLTLTNGVWKVSNIESSTMSIDYVNEAKHLPKIENTVLSDLRA